MVSQSLQSKCNWSGSATKGSPVDTRAERLKLGSSKKVFSFDQNHVRTPSIQNHGALAPERELIFSSRVPCGGLPRTHPLPLAKKTDCHKFSHTSVP